MAESDVICIINREIDRLIGLLNARRDSLLRTVAIIQNNEDKIIEKLEDMKNQTNRLSQHNELFNTHSFIHLQIDQKLEEMRLKKLKKRIKFDFQSQSDEIERLISKWGNILTDEFLLCYEVRKDTRVDDMLRNPETNDEIRDDLAQSPKVTANSKEWRENIDYYIQYGMAIDKANKYIYVAEAKNSFGRISKFSEEGVYLESDNLSDRMRSPYGIAIHGDNMYLTDYKDHFVAHFRIKCGRIVFKFKYGSRGSSNDQFRYPGQLDISPEGDLYIPDLNNRRIQVLGEALNYKATLKHNDLMHPRDVKVRRNQIFILHSTPNCVLLFSRDGDLMTRVLAQQVLYTVNSPNFFCLDSENNFIVSDSKSDTIKVFLMFERKIQTLRVTLEENLKFENIGGILYANGNVLVSSLDEHFKVRMTAYQIKLLPKKSEMYNLEDLIQPDGQEAVISESRNMLDFMKHDDATDLPSQPATHIPEQPETSPILQSLPETNSCSNKNLQNIPENSQN